MKKRRLKKARKKFWRKRPLTQKEEVAVEKYYMSTAGPFEKTFYLMAVGYRKFAKAVGDFVTSIAGRVNQNG